MYVSFYSTFFDFNLEHAMFNKYMHDSEIIASKWRCTFVLFIKQLVGKLISLIIPRTRDAIETEKQLTQ